MIWIQKTTITMTFTDIHKSKAHNTSFFYESSISYFKKSVAEFPSLTKSMEHQQSNTIFETSLKKSNQAMAIRALTRLQQTSLWEGYLWAWEFLSPVADSDLMICLCLSVTLIPWFPGGWSWFQDYRSSVRWPTSEPLHLLYPSCDRAYPCRAHPWAQICLAFFLSVAAVSLFLADSPLRILGWDRGWWPSQEWCRS